MSDDVPYSNADTKGGRTFKGTCDLCGEQIYSSSDHKESCIYKS